MQYLSQFIKKHKLMLIAILFFLTLQVVGTLVIPYLIASMIDNGVMKGDTEAVLKTGLQMLVAALATSAASIYGSYLTADFAAALGRDMRNAVFQKVQDLSVNDFETFGTSSLITRTTSDITNIQNTMAMALQMILPAPLIAAASIIMTILSSPALVTIPIAGIVLFLLVAIIIMKKSSPLSKIIQVKMEKIIQVVRESILGIRVIRAFDNGTYEKKRSDSAFTEYADTMISLNKLFSYLNPVVWAVMGLSMAAIVWFGGFLTAQGSIAVGEITAVTEYTIMTLSYLIMAAMSVVTLPKMKACLNRMTEVLNITPEINDTSVPYSSPDANTVGLEFDHVTFSYRGAENPVLRDLTFQCKTGQTTAIIGGTGSGKSTIAALSARLHDIDAGHIRLNGTDIRDLSQISLRSQIGYVPQKAYLFSGTIAENMQMGSESATKEQMKRAASIAQASDFISGLPDGFDSSVSQGGTNYSGGQKQRLSIARAIVRDAMLYVFDDSFSALDFKTDAALRKAIKHEIKDAAILIIAQRIHTIMDADQIIVLDNGSIAGIGTHDDLMKHCTLYQEIANSQMAKEEKQAV